MSSDMGIAEVCLLLACRDRLREQAGFTERQCEVEFDEMAPGTVGDVYLAIMPAGYARGPRHNTSGGVNDLIYAVDVVVVKRATATPRDRRRNLFTDNLTGLNSQLSKVHAELDFRYEVLDLANALIQQQSESEEGFIEPLRFISVDPKPRVAPAELFGGAGETTAGIMRVARFGGARRITTK